MMLYTYIYILSKVESVLVIYVFPQIDPSQFGIKKIVIKKGEKAESALEYINDKRDRTIIIIYEFESKEARDHIIEMWKKAQQMMSVVKG